MDEQEPKGHTKQISLRMVQLGNSFTKLSLSHGVTGRQVFMPRTSV